jgi:hypothetical protein
MGPFRKVVATCLELERIDGRKVCFEFLRADRVGAEGEGGGTEESEWREGVIPGVIYIHAIRKSCWLLLCHEKVCKHLTCHALEVC